MTKNETQYWDIRINPVRNGFIVQVGCQTFVYSSAITLARDFSKYMKDPAGMEATMLSSSIKKADIALEPIPNLPHPGNSITSVDAVNSGRENTGTLVGIGTHGSGDSHD